MKSITYALVLAIGLWPALTLSPSVAFATDSQTSTSTSTNTGTNTNCVTSANGYQNSSFGHCVTADNQQNSQGDTQDLNNSGAQQSMMLGMMATAAGAGMVAAGMSCAPSPCTGLISAGAALIMAGMMGMQAAGNMANNAGVAGYNGYQMQDLTQHTATGTSIDNGTHTTPGIDIDDSFTRTGKSGVAFDDFENKTGIDRGALVDGLKSGQSVASILAGSDKLKAKGVTEAKVQDALDQAAAGTPMSADEVMNKLGMTPEELAAMAKNGSEGDGSYNMAGASTTGRSPASDANVLGSLLGNGKDGADAGVIGGDLGKTALSSDVQAALDKNGITDLSIFQMVHQKYKVKTPMMFGETARKPGSATENPFSNLGTGGKIEF